MPSVGNGERRTRDEGRSRPSSERAQRAVVLRLSFLWLCGVLGGFATLVYAEVVKPEGATFVGRHELLVSGTPMTTETYTSRDAPQGVIERYTQRLAREGWKLEREQAGLGALFSKSNSLVSIHAAANPSGQTTIAVSSFTRRAGDSPLSVDPATVQRDPNWWKQDVPGGDPPFLPRYPGSIRTSHVTTPDQRFLMLQYLADDSAERIVAFYEGRMSAYGWQLTQKRDVPDELPHEVKEQFAQAVPDMTGATLLFHGEHGTCTIAVVGEPRQDSVILIQHFRLDGSAKGSRGVKR